MKTILRYAAVLLLLGTFNSRVVTVFAQGTAFTYQGQLNAPNGLASGSYDFTFTLFATNATGVAIAGPVTNAAIVVSNGLFTTTVSFGASVFTGSSNWLELAVRTNSTGSFSTLAPRQQVTPTPYAIYSVNAGSAATATTAGSAASATSATTATTANSFSGSLAGDVTGTQGATVVSANIPRLNGTNSFMGTNTYAGVAIATNVNNVFNGAFTGNLAGNASTATSATTAATATTANNFSGTLAGDVTGTQGATVVSANIPRLNGTNSFTGTNNFSGVVLATNVNNVLSGAFTGNGGGLTGLNANNLSSGMVPLAQLGSITSNQLDAATWQLATNLNGGNAASLGGLNVTNFWLLGGNTVAAGQFFGSTNNRAVELRVNGARVLLITTNPADSASFIGGSPANVVDAGVEGAVIAGGGTTNFSGLPSANHISANFTAIGGGSGNWVQPGADHSFIGAGWNNLIASNAYQSVIAGGVFNTNGTVIGVIGGGIGNRIQPGADNSTIAGGQKNLIQRGANNSTIAGGQNNVIGAVFLIYQDFPGDFITNTYGGSTVSGGYNNTATNVSATVGGGFYNTASGVGSVVAGGGSGFFLDPVNGPFFSGNGNTASGDWSAIGGGLNNQATNSYATVPGGANNMAGGQYSFAAGREAQATNDGAFVWADSQGSTFASTTNDSFNVRARGGVRFLTGGAGMTLDGQPVLAGSNGGGLTNLNVSTAQLSGGANNNVFIGPAGGSLTFGQQNTASGSSALHADTTGSFNVANGNLALFSNTNGDFNTANGAYVLSANTSGSGNTADGAHALEGNVSGSENTAVGDFALAGLGQANSAGGSNNIALGSSAGFKFKSNESSNIDIGNVGVLNDQNIIRIGTGQTQTYLAGVINGNGGGLTNLNAAQLTGALPAISGANLTSLPANVALLGASQSFTGGNTFTGTTTVTNFNAVNSLNVYGTQTGGWPNPVSLFENKSTAATASPALRVVCDGGTNPDGALSVSVSTGVNGLIAEFGNSTAFVVRITNNGSIFAAGNVYANGVLLTSDRNAKEHFKPVDNQAVLAKVAALPVTEWNYRSEATAMRHIGPMAQDFHASFGLDGNDDKHISVVDEGGVALAAIQGLNEKVEASSQGSEVRLQKLEAENVELKARLDKLEQLLAGNSTAAK